MRYGNIDVGSNGQDTEVDEMVRVRCETCYMIQKYNVELLESNAS